MPELTLIDSFEEATQFMSWLGERRPGAIAVDTETGGFDWWRDELRLVQVGDAEHGWAMRWDRWSGLFQEFVRQYEGIMAMHNFKFDCEYIQHNGIELPLHRVDDTRTMAHLVDPARGTGLKPLANALIKRGMSTGQDRLHQFFKSHKWDWRDVPYALEEYWVYAAADTVMTAKLHDILSTQLTANRRELYDVEMAAQIALLEMEMKGMRIDLEYCARKNVELTEWAVKIREWAAEEFGVANLGSDKQVAERLMADGWEPNEWNATGPKFTKEIVEQIDHPLAKVRVQMKHAEKMAGTYFSNFLEKADGDILHAKINPLGTITGRMTVSDPALQTLPREALVRDAFIPHEGNRLVLIDYDAMEVKLTCHFEDGDDLTRAVLESPDMHKNTASITWKIDPEDVTPKQRQIAKNGIYAWIYGAGPTVLSTTLGISIGEAKELHNGLKRAYPSVVRWKDRLERESVAAMVDGYAEVETPRGRRQRARRDESWKLANYLVQGSGADVLKTKLAELSAAGFGEYMVLPIHDEIAFDVPAEDAEEVMHAATQIMTDDAWRIPLTVEGTIVDRWGTKYRKKDA